MKRLGGRRNRTVQLRLDGHFESVPPLHYDPYVSPEAQLLAPVKVERDDVRVMFMRVSEVTPAAIQHAWAKFEVAAGLKGRKFFGALDNEAREYRVCAQLRRDDDPEALGFEVGTLPGGTYLRTRLQGEPPAIYERIPSTWEELVEGGRIRCVETNDRVLPEPRRDRPAPPGRVSVARSSRALLSGIPHRCRAVPATMHVASLKAHTRAHLPSRRHAGDALSPRLGSAIRSTPVCPDGLVSEGANDGCRCDRPVRARFERRDRAGGTPRGLALR